MPEDMPPVTRLVAAVTVVCWSIAVGSLAANLFAREQQRPREAPPTAAAVRARAERVALGALWLATDAGARHAGLSPDQRLRVEVLLVAEAGRLEDLASRARLTTAEAARLFEAEFWRKDEALLGVLTADQRAKFYAVLE